MRITVITLFPEMYEEFSKTSIIGRSIAKGIVTIDFVQIRDFAKDHYKHVDDAPFGGGAGMIMKCQPALDALASVKQENSYCALMAPTGSAYTQAKAHELSKQEHLILFCGHYEGVDARVEQQMDDVISIGDYILTGGELASMVVIDSIVRLLKGSIKEDSIQEESFENGLLEYPQFTQPASYQGRDVPEVLLSGDHERIRKWRLTQSLLRTKTLRPDLWEKHTLTKEEEKLLKKFEDDNDE